MRKAKENLLTIVPFILAIIFNLVMYAAGIGCVLHSRFLYGRVLLWISVALLVICMVGSPIGATLYSRRFNNMAEDELLHYILSGTKKLQTAFEQAEKNILRLKNRVTVYYAFVILLTLAISFFYGTAKYGSEVSYVLLLCSVYIQADLLHILISIATEKPDFSQYADSASYPFIENIAKQAEQAVGVNGDIRLAFSDECNAGIQQFGKTYAIELGVPLLAVLTPEELYQVFLHEFAHMQDEHIRVNQNARRFFIALEACGATATGYANRFLFALPSAVFTTEFAIFDAASSELNEAQADTILHKKGNPKAAAAGLAKTAMYESYIYEYPLLYPKHFYADPTPPLDICTRDCTRFRRAIELRKSEWISMLEQELPGRLQTHPTFRQRLEALENPQFSICLPENTSPYFREVMHAASDIDKILYDLNYEEYDTARAEEYLAPLSVIQNYEKNKKPLSAVDSRPIIEAYIELHRFDEAQAICKEILAHAKNDAEAAHASFALGCLLLLHYDARGTEYVQKAIETNAENYAETGFEYLGRFYSKMGMEKELSEHRKHVDAFLHTQEQRNAITELSHKDSLHLVSQDDMRKAQIAHIAALCGDAVQKIYLLRKDISESMYTYAYILRFADSIDETTQDEIVTTVFNYLDTENDQYSLFVYDKSYKKIFKAVGNCCVYEK